MLLAICYQLREALTARGVPWDVVDGPERLGQTTTAIPHIVLERDRQTGDLYAPPTTDRRNPRLDHVRWIGAVLRVFAKSSVASARPMDHEREADLIVDQCMVALRGIVSARKTLWQIGSAKLLTADEANERGLESWPGVIYEVRFAVARGVTDAPFDGTTASEATFGGAHGVGTSTTLDLSDGPDGSEELPSATTRM